jgi:hypothetical protein
LVVKGQLAGQVPMHGKVTAKNSCVWEWRLLGLKLL